MPIINWCFFSGLHCITLEGPNACQVSLTAAVAPIHFSEGGKALMVLAITFSKFSKLMITRSLSRFLFSWPTSEYVYFPNRSGCQTLLAWLHNGLILLNLFYRDQAVLLMAMVVNIEMKKRPLDNRALFGWLIGCADVSLRFCNSLECRL